MEYQRREKGLAFIVKVVSWVQGIFFYLGLFMFLVMGGAGWKLWALYTAGETAAGRVLRFHESQGSNSATAGPREQHRDYPLYYPVIQFEAEGRSWEFTSSHGGRGHNYRTGQEVEVVYSPGDPRKAELARSVKTFSGLWAAVIGFFLFGLSLMFLSRLLPRLVSRFAGLTQGPYTPVRPEADRKGEP